MTNDRAPAPVCYTRINPATVNTIHTNRNPNIATSAPKKQINEVSMNSMSLFSFVIGRHPPVSHLHPFLAEDAGMTENQ